MGASLYVVLERDIPGFDHVNFINGDALATALIDHEEEMETFARRSGVTPLLEFIGAEADDMDDYLDDEDDEEDDFTDEIEEGWFEATEGLKSVQGILDYLVQHPEALQGASFGTNASLREPVIEDLEKFETIMTKAKIEGILWRLEMDV